VLASPKATLINPDLALPTYIEARCHKGERRRRRRRRRRKSPGRSGCKGPMQHTFKANSLSVVDKKSCPQD
jgi:hypothetical protein